MNSWRAERAWATSVEHVKRVIRDGWPAPLEAILAVMPQPGELQRTVVRLTPVGQRWSRSLALAWLRGLDRRLDARATPPRTVSLFPSVR